MGHERTVWREAPGREGHQQLAGSQPASRPSILDDEVPSRHVEVDSLFSGVCMHSWCWTSLRASRRVMGVLGEDLVSTHGLGAASFVTLSCLGLDFPNQRNDHLSVLIRCEMREVG